MEVERSQILRKRISVRKNYDKWRDENQWKLRVERAKMPGREYRIRSLRLQRYAKNKQLRNGVFYCLGGKPITEDRIKQYEPMCHYMIKMFLPAGALFEGCYSYEDLVNSCRTEVFLALLDGFDPEKAMKSSVDDPVDRAKREEAKRLNPDKAMNDAEKNIIFGRLKNYLRRLRWRYCPDNRGGKGVSMDAILDGADQGYGRGMYSDPTPYAEQADIDKDSLIEILETHGAEAAKKAFFDLDRDRRDSVLELINKPTVFCVSEKAGMDEAESEPVMESNANPD
jgi:hypothetical protein